MDFFKKFTGGYEELWKAIIRPPRDIYEISDLGPKEFYIDNRSYKRTDLQLTNSRGMTLECSHFEPIDQERVVDQLPCVIYLHGNCSSRVEALIAVPVLLPCNISVFCLDLSGCGRSEGEYISLGWYERDDVALVVDHLRSSNRVTCIGLWGRSMGATTSLLHGDRDPSIAGMVLDSPFSSLRTLAEELTRTYAKLPKLIVSGAISIIRKTIKNKAGFDIDNLNSLDHVEQCFIPALFVAGREDTFIQPHHAQELYEKYVGDKNIRIVDGDHNSLRPKFLLDSIAIFFYNTLMCDNLPKSTHSKTKSKKRKAASGFNPAEHQNAFMLEEEEVIRRAIQESLKESNSELSLELKEDEFVDLYEDKASNPDHSSEDS